MNRPSAFLLIASVAVFAGCSSISCPHDYPAQGLQGKARLVFYRPSKRTSSARSPRLSLNGKPLCDLESGQFTSVLVDPGVLTARAKWAFDLHEDDSLQVSLAAGETRYVRVIYPVSKLQGVLAGGGMVGAAIIDDRAGILETNEVDFTAQK